MIFITPLDLLLSFISRHVACHFVWWLSKYLHGHGEKLFDVCTQRSRLLINKTTDQTNDSTLCIQSISSWGLRRGWGGRSGGLDGCDRFKTINFFLRLSILLRRTLYKMYWNSKAKIPGILDFLLPYDSSICFFF